MDPSKSKYVADIVALNPSASTEFLETFSADELRNYLRRLKSLPHRQRPGRREFDCFVDEAV